MNNPFFILSEKSLLIDRFHLCTWDLIGHNSFIELGFEVNWKTPDNLKESEVSSEKEESGNAILDSIELTIIAPILQKVKDNTDVVCLAKRLVKSENCKFIFNDYLESWSEIQDDSRNGVNLTFAGRGDLTILPIDIKEFNNQTGFITLSVEIPKSAHDQIYFRILVKSSAKTLALPKKGITKSTYIFDIRINEQRNLSDSIHDVIKHKHLKLCVIKNYFCFHIIPNNFEISFIDDEKLNSVRMLETDAFNNYLSDEVGQTIEKKKYIIIFNKWKSKNLQVINGCSFFSIFNKEILGTGQIVLAIGANIICSLLFAIGTFRYGFTASSEDSKWYRDIPNEYYGAGIILVGLIIYLFRHPIKRFWASLKDKFGKKTK